MSLDFAFHSHRKILSSFCWDHSPSLQKLKPICWWQSRWERNCTLAADLSAPESSYLHSSCCCCCFCRELKKRSGSHPIFQAPFPRFLPVSSGSLEKWLYYKLYPLVLSRGCLCGQTTVWPTKQVPHFLADTKVARLEEVAAPHSSVGLVIDILMYLACTSNEP